MGTDHRDREVEGFKNGGVIDKKDLDVFDFEVAPNYWGLINGLKNYDIKNRLYAFETMLAANDPPAKIFNILASQWQEKTPHMAEYDLASSPERWTMRRPWWTY